MSKIVHLSDTSVILDGCQAGIQAFIRAMERTNAINEFSKYKIDQRVRIKDDVPGIVDLLMSANYPYLDAIKLAKYLAESEVQVISPDKLWTKEGEEKLFYTVALDTGEFHILSEDLLEEIV